MQNEMSDAARCFITFEVSLEINLFERRAGKSFDKHKGKMEKISPNHSSFFPSSQNIN